MKKNVPLDLLLGAAHRMRSIDPCARYEVSDPVTLDLCN